MKLTDLLNTGTENMNEAPASQSNTSIAKMTIFGLPVLFVLYVGAIYAVNAILPESDAARVKPMLDIVFAVVGGSIGLGPTALQARSLMLTAGKIKSQTPNAPDTVNVATTGTVQTGSTPVQPLADGLPNWRQFESGLPPDWVDSDAPDIDNYIAETVMQQESEVRDGLV